MSRASERDQETVELEVEARPSRSAERRERKASEAALADLAMELCGLSERRLAGLGLPEMVERAVREARRISSPAARNRALRLVRQELRASDWSTVATRLKDADAPRRSQPAPGAEAVAAWRARLIEEGDGAIDALLRLCPRGERKVVRVLVRNLRHATPKTEARARQALERWLGEQLKTSGEPTLQPPVVDAADERPDDD